MQTDFVSSTVLYLRDFQFLALEKSLEGIRIARSVASLSLAGKSNLGISLQDTANYLLAKQQNDGGWADPEETAWACAVLEGATKKHDSSVQAAMKWLDSTRKSTGGWGQHERDKARIKTTALVAALVPDVVTPQDIDWLINEWQRDFSSPVRLSYKAGFFLLAVPEGRVDNLVDQTIAHLAEDQNDDGGFAPWRNHPIGSDPWSTGIVLWGLSRWVNRVDRSVIEKALAWLERTQLPNGYWAYHYLDDGTSIALIGAVSAMKALAGSE